MAGEDKKSEKGYTLMELLVTAAILAVVGGIAIEAFVSILRLGLRTKALRTLRQNASVIMDKVERSVRGASDVADCGIGSTTLFLRDNSGVTRLFECRDGGVVLTVGEGTGESLNGSDVTVGECSFSCQQGEGMVVEFDFTLTHRLTRVEESYRTFVSQRNY